MAHTKQITASSAGWDEFLGNTFNYFTPDSAAACYTSTTTYPTGVCYKFNKNASNENNFISYSGGTCTKYTAAYPYLETSACQSGVCPLDNRPCLSPANPSYL